MPALTSRLRAFSPPSGYRAPSWGEELQEGWGSRCGVKQVSAREASRSGASTHTHSERVTDPGRVPLPVPVRPPRAAAVANRRTPGLRVPNESEYCGECVEG